MLFRGFSRWVYPVGIALLLCGGWGTSRAGAQSTSQSPAPSVSPRPNFGADSTMEKIDPGSHTGLRLEHMREDDRRKRLQADMARLVELTNELKTQVDSTSKDELSVEVVRKAGEIEKLAHDVKERMKD